MASDATSPPFGSRLRSRQVIRYKAKWAANEVAGEVFGRRERHPGSPLFRGPEVRRCLTTLSRRVAYTLPRLHDGDRSC
ncbi:hypothetical protein MRX96_047533 [Rhipicephalus microplus]